MNLRHPDPWRVLGRCRAAVRGQDPGDPRRSGDGLIFAPFSISQHLVEGGSGSKQHRGAPEPGNLAREPPEPAIHGMSNILLRKQAIQEGAPEPGNPAR